MARTQTRSSGLFSGLVLLSVGVLLLLHNYGHLRLQSFFAHWWPLLIIFWGAVKLYERTLGRRLGTGTGAFTGGEVFLVLAMLSLLGIVVAVEIGKEKLGDIIDVPGDRFSYDLDVAPATIPSNTRVLIRTGRGDVTVRASDDQQIHVSAKKNVKTWNETEADRIAKPMNVVITQNGDAYEVHPSGFDISDPRFSVDVEVAVPAKSPLTVRVDKGDVEVSDMAAGVNVVDKLGDVEVRDTTGDVSIEMNKGDAKTSDTTGDVKISGHGGEVEVNTTTGTVTVDGDFYGPVRADKIAKGVRLVSPRTDLTVSSLSGHLEAGSGNLDLIDAPGNITLRTRDTEINVENPGGKVNIDNRNASVSVRFSSPPKDDVQVTNSSSSISLTLPGSSSFEIQADCRNCDIDSEFPALAAVKSPSGDASLLGKYGSGRGPKITLHTSYGNISLTRTSALAPPKPPAPPMIPPAKPPKVPQIPPPSEQ
jgi:Toastrack DUF4097/LiaI-LiaF-like transmembrane region